jgi:uncharacterized cupredoxin-like copper-binding protein
MHRTAFAATLVFFVAAPVHAHGDAAHPAAPSLQSVTTAFGRTGEAAKVTRTIVIDMSDDMRFTPREISVSRNDTVRFRVRNRGKLVHEFVIGTKRELAEHAEMMKRFPAMEHDEPYMAHVTPGATGEVTWQFTEPGTFRFACLMPGHSWNDLRDGMVGTIVVR